MRIRFHLRPVPLIATCLLVVLGIALAQWQTRRAHDKQVIQAQMLARAEAPVLQLTGAPIDAAAVSFRRVRVKGHFVSDWPIYLDNRPQDGRPGMYVVMPFQIAGSGTQILIERGWIPLNRAARNTVFPYQTPPGEIELGGIARLHAGHVMQLGAPAVLHPGAIVQNLDETAFAKAARLSLLPLLIEQTDVLATGADGMVRNWPKPSSGIEMHQGYAFQWYALALMALLFFVVTGFRREPD